MGEKRKNLDSLPLELHKAYKRHLSSLNHSVVSVIKTAQAVSVEIPCVTQKSENSTYYFLIACRRIRALI